MINGLSDVELMEGLGYAGSASQGTLLAAIDSLPAERKQAAMAKIVAAKVGGADKTIRDLAIERLDFLPKEILQGLAAKRLQIVQSEIYAVKYIEDKTQVSFFLDADTVAEGFTNLNNGKLKKDEWFLACGIQYTEGVGASSTNPTAAFFTTPGAKTANGDFDFKANGGKLMLNERTPLSVFTDISPNGGFQGKICTMGLENPKWIEPQVKIDFNVRYAAADATDNLFGRVKIIGAAIITL